MRLIIVFFFTGFLTLHAQVGIGTTNPSAASMLEIASSSDGSSFKGLMPPRVTLSQRDQINPSATDVGLLIFVYDPDANLSLLQVWNGAAWEDIHVLNATSTSTAVNFQYDSQSGAESQGGVTIALEITNPDSENPIEVSIGANSYDDLFQDGPITITVPPETTLFSSESFTLLPDEFYEIDESVVFSILAVNSEGNAIVGENNTFEFTIINDDIAPSPVVWINEFHYDNIGADAGEFVEIAGVATTDLSSYSIVHYNGANGSVISTTELSGLIPDEGKGFGAIMQPFDNLQNGNDGLALVDDLGNVLQFISYEGSFTASAGPALGMTAVDIDVSETNDLEEGFSLQLKGIGSAYGQFNWSEPSSASPGTINEGQTFN